MTGLSEFLAKVLSVLEDLQIPYMVSGSLGSVHHGEPRATRDVDVVIDPTATQLRALVSRLQPTCYVSLEAALEALSERSMFNIIDLDSGWKADLVIRKARPFSEVELARRRSVSLMGRQTFVVSPEDSILSKLEWARDSGSERQLRDAAGVVRVQGDRLDRDYLRAWASELGLTAQLEALLR